MSGIPADITGLVGQTPMIQLQRALNLHHFSLFAKLEGYNPGGSIKDRPALQIISEGVQSGLITSRTTVIESSSGNMGIGLAQICHHFGLRFICVIDPKTTSQNVGLLRTYGAEVELVREPDSDTGEFLPARLRRVRELLATYPNTYWPNQYANRANARAHHNTMREIMESLNGNVDYVFCSTSTCGTLRGCAEYVYDQKSKVRLVAVDATGSVIFGTPRANRLLPGHGASITPGLYCRDLAERCVHISDYEAVLGCRRLLKRETLLVGGSSGAVLMAIERMAEEILPGARCVGIFPDRGERYLDTIFSDAWISEHFKASLTSLKEAD